MDVSSNEIYLTATVFWYIEIWTLLQTLNYVLMLPSADIIITCIFKNLTVATLKCFYQMWLMRKLE